jgi:hypothetical protein
MEINEISVIRFGFSDEINPKLREALFATEYHPATPMYQLPKGGKHSVLITMCTFEQVVEIVKNADCGETVTVIDNDAMRRGDSSRQVTILSIKESERGPINEEVIQNEIDRLMKKRSEEGLDETEASTRRHGAQVRSLKP